MRWHVLLLSLSSIATLEGILASTTSHAPCESDYANWLSTPDALVREDQTKSFPGLHVLCLWRDHEGQGSRSTVRVEAFSGGIDARSMHNRPKDFTLDASQLESWKAFRASLKEKLSFKKASNSWGHASLKQAFGIFDRAGRRLSQPSEVIAAQMVLLFEGGQWIWPPVRQGYIRKLKNGVELETMSLQPILYRVRGFLKPSECQEIIGMGKPHMFNSPVTLMDKDKGKDAKEFRTSTQARLQHKDFSLLQDLDSRVAMVTRVPASNNEEVQILRYQKTQYYSAHLDNWDPMYYSDSSWMQHGHKNRMATVFWYLSDVKEGGETLFPRAYGLQQPRDLYACEQGLKIKPEVGAIILWYSLHPNGNTDPNGLHSACPVKGDEEKWSANYWVWNKPTDNSALPDDGVDDADETELIVMNPSANSRGNGLRTPTNEVKVRFRNTLAEVVRLFWKSPQGAENFMMDIERGSIAHMNTFIGHQFVARRRGSNADELFGPFKVGSDNQEFILNAPEVDSSSEF